MRHNILVVGDGRSSFRGFGRHVAPWCAACCFVLWYDCRLGGVRHGTVLLQFGFNLHLLLAAGYYRFLPLLGFRGVDLNCFRTNPFVALL
jgi:hypothetical protein